MTAQLPPRDVSGDLDALAPNRIDPLDEIQLGAPGSLLDVDQAAVDDQGAGHAGPLVDHWGAGYAAGAARAAAERAAAAACPRPHLDDLVPVVLPRKIWVQLGGWIVAHDTAECQPQLISTVIEAIGRGTA